MPLRARGFDLLTLEIRSGEDGKLADLLSAITSYKRRLLAVVVHLNDTYLIEERKDRSLPGFPRVIGTVRRVRAHVKRVCHRDCTLVLHSGDFLGPSQVGRTTKGSIMIQLLAMLGLDAYVPGNHEFDYGPQVFIQRATALNDARKGRCRIVLANTETNELDIGRILKWPTEV